MTVILQFARENRWTSNLITWFTQGNVSHVDAVFDDGLLGSFERTIPPYPSGVDLRKPGYVNFAARVRFYIPSTNDQTARFRAFLMSQMFKPYDHLAILAFALNRDWHEQDAWICSELQAAALEASGILPYSLYADTNKITPMALALALSALPGVTHEISL